MRNEEFLQGEHREQHPPEGAREQFERLKHSRLYDPVKKEWTLPLIDRCMIEHDKKQGIDIHPPKLADDAEHGVEIDPRYTPSDVFFKMGGVDRKRTYEEPQLMGIIVEGLFDATAAREQLSHLRASREQTYVRRPNGDQLLELIAQHIAEGGDIASSFKSLQSHEQQGYMTISREDEITLWGEMRYEEEQDVTTMKVFIQELYAYLLDTQLLAVLAQLQFDKEGAKERFEELQKVYYDQEKGKWIHEINWGHHFGVYTSEYRDKDPHWYAGDELLAVLIEAHFDLKKAREHYTRLQQQQSIFHRGGWVHPFSGAASEASPVSSVEQMIRKGQERSQPSFSEISEKGVEGSESAFLQLVDVWIQKKFEESH